MLRARIFSTKPSINYILTATFFSLVLFLNMTTVHANDIKQNSFADLAEQLLPSVVNISTTQRVEERKIPETLPDMPEGSPFEHFFEEFMNRRQQQVPSTPASSLGSGFVIDAQNGYIVTNNHVIADADEVKITLFDDRVLNAEIIGRDEKTDLAVLKVDPKEAKEANLIPVPFGNSDTMRVGDWVIAIGNPFGLGGTVTAGIISARQRDINAGPYDDFIQTDASINRGNSGGPMFNLKGEVIGINTAIYSPSGGSVGIGFAIPSSMAQPILDQLIKFGRTRRGWLGVRIQNVTDDIADSLGIEKAKGALVASVTKDGPAEKAGLKAGDVILEFDSKEVTAMRSLPRIVAETDIDKDVPIKIWRDGRPKTVTAKIGELEEAEKKGILENDTVVSGEGDARGYKIKNLDVSAANLDDALRQEFGISPDIAGVVITHIEDGSDAAQKGLRPGDVIIEVNQNPVLTPEEVNELVQNARRSGRSSALFLINREGDMRFVALRFSAQ